jgi:hypothetical protein
MRGKSVVLATAFLCCTLGRLGLGASRSTTERDQQHLKTLFTASSQPRRLSVSEEPGIQPRASSLLFLLFCPFVPLRRNLGGFILPRCPFSDTFKLWLLL